MRMAEVEPGFPLIALTNRAFLQVDQPGASPWLGGIDFDDFDDSLVNAAASFGADAISPVHGFPQNGTVADAGYEPYVTRAMVDEAHAAGLGVVPWTVDDKPTMSSMMDKGVDGLITDYPDRLRELLADRGLRLPRAYREVSSSGILTTSRSGQPPTRRSRGCDPRTGPGSSASRTARCHRPCSNGGTGSGPSSGSPSSTRRRPTTCEACRTSRSGSPSTAGTSPVASSPVSASTGASCTSCPTTPPTPTGGSDAYAVSGTRSRGQDAAARHRC